MDPIGGIGFLCERLVDVLSYKFGPKNGHVGIPSQLLIDMQDDVVQKVMQDVIFHVLAERVVVEYVGFAGQGVQEPHSLSLFPTLVVFRGGIGGDHWFGYPKYGQRGGFARRRYGRVLIGVLVVRRCSDRSLVMHVFGGCHSTQQ